VKATSTVDTSVSGTATVSVKIRQMLLGFVFPAATEGYEDQTPLEVPVINKGNQPTGELTAALSGRNKDDFILSKSTIGSLAANGRDSFSVKPKTVAEGEAATPPLHSVDHRPDDSPGMG